MKDLRFLTVNLSGKADLKKIKALNSLIIKKQTMKTLHYRWNRSLNWILTTLLGFLGFSSCEDNGDDPGNIICMYGTPTASYTIKGKVTDQAGQALSDIQIIVSDMEFSYEPRPDFIPDTPYGSHPVNDTLYSGKEGEFETRQAAFPIDTVKYNLKINPRTKIIRTTMPIL